MNTRSLVLLLSLVLAVACSPAIGHLARVHRHAHRAATPAQPLPRQDARLANPQAPLSVRRVRHDGVPITLIEGGIAGTRRSARRCDVRRFVADCGALAGLNGTFFANASLRGRDNRLIGPTLCGGENRPTLGPCDHAAALAGRPLVLLSPTQTRVVSYQPTRMDDEAGLRRLLPQVSDAFLGGVWLVHGGRAASAGEIARAHVRDAEDFRRRAFFVLEPDGRPGLGATTDVTSSARLAQALADSGVREAVLLDSGFSTSLVMGRAVVVTGHTARGLPSRPVPHAVVLYAPRPQTPSRSGPRLRSRNMNEPQAIALVAEVLEAMPLAAVFQAFGGRSVTYEVVLPDRRVIVRMNEDARVFATTERNIAALAELGLPVPKVLASDLSKSRHPFAYMLLDKIPGRDLRYELAHMTPAQMTRLAEQMVNFQRRVTALPPGTGYGYVGIGETGPHASWWEMIRPCDGPSGAQASDSLVGEYEARVLCQISRFEPFFRAVLPLCFLDDITIKNVIVQKGELQGLVDFDCVCYGDPLYWLALTATGVVSDVGTAELFYVEELKRLWGLTPEQGQVLALYSAWLSLGFVQRFAARETAEWKLRMLGAVEQWLRSAENLST